jgi:alpha-1,6-mannosyltransferase
MMLRAVHNDYAMLPLLVGGVAVAASQRTLWRALVVGGVLVGLAASIKVTALFVLPFLPLVWFRYAGDVRGAPPIDAMNVRRWLVNGASACAIGSSRCSWWAR